MHSIKKYEIKKYEIESKEGRKKMKRKEEDENGRFNFISFHEKKNVF
jgi:hypothetical protein